MLPTVCPVCHKDDQTNHYLPPKLLDYFLLATSISFCFRIGNWASKPKRGPESEAVAKTPLPCEMWSGNTTTTVIFLHTILAPHDCHCCSSFLLLSGRVHPKMWFLLTFWHVYGHVTFLRKVYLHAPLGFFFSITQYNHKNYNDECVSQQMRNILLVIMQHSKNWLSSCNYQLWKTQWLIHAKEEIWFICMFVTPICLRYVYCLQYVNICPNLKVVADSHYRASSSNPTSYKLQVFF